MVAETTGRLMKDRHSAAPWFSTEQLADGSCHIYAHDTSLFAMVFGWRSHTEINASLFAAAPNAPHECEIIGCPGRALLRVLRLTLKHHKETDFLGGLGDWLTDYMARFEEAS